MKGQIPLLCLTIVLFIGCRSENVITTWNANHSFQAPYPKIMVAVIINAKHDSLRKYLEGYMSKEISGLGYRSISTMESFGAKGLSDMSNEDTYLKLCNAGIDAVMILALIDKQKQRQFQIRNASMGTSSYFYKRIWNYRKMQSEVLTGEFSTRPDLWEITLFDLSTLEPLYVIQYQLSHGTEKRMNTFIEKIVQKFQREGLLRKQPIPIQKPF